MKDLDFGVEGSGKLQALLSFLLAVFMTAIGVGILGAPMDMKPILGLLLKAFIALVFGGIAALCILYAIRTLWGPRGLPSEVYARCLTCGERTPHDLVCPVCAEPPQDRSAVIRVNSDDLFGQIFGALILTGVGCLGIFIMIGPYLDGERRLWALIAFFALGLLMFVLGLAGFWGLVLAFWNGIKKARDFSFSCRGPDRFTQGNGKLAWSRLFFMRGNGQVSAPLTAKGRPEGGYRVSAGDMRLAEAIATFDAAGFIEMVDLTTYDWCVGDASGKTRSRDPEFKRTVDRRIIMKLSGAAFGVWHEEHEDDDEAEPVHSAPSPELQKNRDDVIGRYLARYMLQPQSLAEFKQRLDADPLHRAQLETHANALRDRGVVVSSGLVEAVIEALLRPASRTE